MTTVMRPILLALLAATALTVPANAANSVVVTAGPTETMGGTMQHATYNVVVHLDANQCPGGSADITVTVAAATTTPGVTATVDGPTLTFKAGQQDTVSKAWDSKPQTVTVVLEAGNITAATTANYTVTATAGPISCALPVLPVNSVTPGAATAEVTFTPASTQTSQASSEAPVPGLELPLLAAAIVGIALVVRRKTA